MAATISLLSPQLHPPPRSFIFLSTHRSSFINFLSNSQNPTKVFLRSRSAFFEEEEGETVSSNSSSRFEGAVDLFNNREYYACHDVVESLWYSSIDPTRTFLHALLQCAVGFHHLFNQNHKGAMMELGEAVCKLRKLEFEGGPFHQFEREISDVLEFIYQTQLELAALMICALQWSKQRDRTSYLVALQPKSGSIMLRLTKMGMRTLCFIQ